MNGYILRNAGIEDIPALAVLRVDFLCEGKEASADARALLFDNNVDFLREGFSSGSFSAIVAEYEGEIVATSGLVVYRLMPNPGCLNGVTGYIANMYTVPRHRKQGIATALFGQIVEEAKRRGCGRIMLSATAMGKPIYEKYGFTRQEGAMSYSVGR